MENSNTEWRLGRGSQGKEEEEALGKENRATVRCRDKSQDSKARCSPLSCLS